MALRAQDETAPRAQRHRPADNPLTTSMNAPTRTAETRSATRRPP